VNAHWINESDWVLVTGTLDVVEAENYLLSTEPDMVDFISETEAQGRPARGIIYPAGQYSDYDWFWAERKKGRVKAVIFGA
jgi:hypothetical protein